jgi:hypothetical protein
LMGLGGSGDWSGAADPGGDEGADAEADAAHGW